MCDAAHVVLCTLHRAYPITFVTPGLRTILRSTRGCCLNRMGVSPPCNWRQTLSENIFRLGDCLTSVAAPVLFLVSLLCRDGNCTAWNWSNLQHSSRAVSSMPVCIAAFLKTRRIRMVSSMH